MKLARSRLVAGALSLAVAGSATGGVIAARRTTRRRGPRPPSRAASRSRPRRVEPTAKRGTVGTFTVKNTTKDTLRVTVNVRPWIQNRSTGHGRHQHAGEPVAVRRASPQTFNLKPGSRRVSSTCAG